MNRRRPFEGDDFDYNHRNQKRVCSSENLSMGDRLESLILQVGEHGITPLEQNLEGLASILVANLDEFRGMMLRLLADCAVKMPEKCTIYSTLVGLLNAKNYIFGGELVNYMVKAFEESLLLCRWDIARYSIRFFADLVNCNVISAPSLMQLYESLINVSGEDSLQVRRDWYVFAVLSSLPWVGRDLYEKDESALDALMLRIEVYMNKRSKRHCNAVCVWTVDAPYPQEDYLDSLWSQMRKLRLLKWTEGHIIRPYLALETILCEALQHTLPRVVPPPYRETNVYPMPAAVFRMFDCLDCLGGPMLPDAGSIERYLIEDHLHQVIATYHLDRKECTTQLLASPFKTKIPLEYCIVEVIFAELFALPKPRYLEIAYGSILIELCNSRPSTLSGIIAQATNILFIYIDSMNVACFDRFVSWFSYHLSNFNFIWSWEEWDSCLLADRNNLSSKFVQEVLLKCLRLSYYQRIVQIVPKPFEKLLPALPKPNYKYASDESVSLNGAQVAHQLVVAIRHKCMPHEVINILESLSESGSTVEAEKVVSKLKIDVFVQTLLNLGSKSFSHCFSFITKFHMVFKTIAPTEETQVLVLHNVFELWRNHQQMLVVTVDKLLKTQLVSGAAVATWIFTDEMVKEFPKMFLWEILHSTINKMSKYVMKLFRELAEAKEKLHTVDSKEKVANEKSARELIDSIDEKFEAARAEEKRVFLIVFQRFVEILSKHFMVCAQNAQDPNSNWYYWTMGRLQQVFSMHHEQVQHYTASMETEVFTADVDPRLLEVFQQFKALRA